MLKGLDVSKWQGKPDWKKVKESSPVKFVYAKSSEGVSTSPDGSFLYNWNELKKAGLYRGAYHFYRPSQDPVAQAEVFYKIVGPLEDDDLPPMADIEVEGPKGQSGAEYAKNARKFVERLEELFQRKSVIYTGGPIFNLVTKGAPKEDFDFFADRDLWLAAYVRRPNDFVPKAWAERGKTWAIWQYSGDVDASGKPGLRVAGIDAVVDANATQGIADDIPAWIESTKPKKPTIETITEEPKPQPIDTLPSPAIVTPTVTTALEIPPQPPTPEVSMIVPQQEPAVGFFQMILKFLEMLFSIFRRKQ